MGSDPLLSVHQEETVMDYRSSLGSSWPNAYSVNDLEALASTWGEVIQAFTRQSEQIAARESSDFLSAGDNDMLRDFNFVAGSCQGL